MTDANILPLHGRDTVIGRRRTIFKGVALRNEGRHGAMYGSSLRQVTAPMPSGGHRRTLEAGVCSPVGKGNERAAD